MVEEARRQDSEIAKGRIRGRERKKQDEKCSFAACFLLLFFFFVICHAEINILSGAVCFAVSGVVAIKIRLES